MKAKGSGKFAVNKVWARFKSKTFAHVLCLAMTLGFVTPSLAQSTSALSGINVAASRLGELPRDERQILLAINAILEARLDDAERHLEAVLQRQPNFRLARLVYADVLRTRSTTHVNFNSGHAAQQVAALLDEARLRIAHARGQHASNQVPLNLLSVSAQTPRVVMVDIEAARLYLFANTANGVQLLRSVYVSTAKNGAGKRREGDQRTPVGVYFVTGEIDPSALPDFYGAGALPVNYPNEWDLRQGRTGYGIWLHGVPNDTFARSPRASDGCVALSNDYMLELLSLPDVKGTPVIIAQRLDWTSPQDNATRQRELEQLLAAWRTDWESRDVDRYARHYSRNFVGGKGSREQWLEYKRRINGAKTFIRVKVDNINAFIYPGEMDVLMVDFDQSYESNNYNSRSRKRQYWQREDDGVWRIIHEDEPKLLPVHLRGMPFSARARMSAR